MSQFICANCHKGFDRLAAYEEHTEKEECKMISMFGRTELEILTALKFYDERVKMTREEARAKLNEIGRKHNFDRTISAEATLDIYEAFGFIKFEKPLEPKIHGIFQLDDNNGYAEWHKYACADNSEKLNKIIKKFGTIRLEEWSEGLVLWVGGEIVWKSWEKYHKQGDAVTIEYYGGASDGRKFTQAGIIK